jgi:hypothetical protein
MCASFVTLLASMWISRASFLFCFKEVQDVGVWEVLSHVEKSAQLPYFAVHAMIGDKI